MQLQGHHNSELKFYEYTDPYVTHMDHKWVLLWLPCKAPGANESVLRLVSLVSVIHSVVKWHEVAKRFAVMYGR